KLMSRTWSLFALSSYRSEIPHADADAHGGSMHSGSQNGHAEQNDRCTVEENSRRKILTIHTRLHAEALHGGVREQHSHQRHESCPQGSEKRTLSDSKKSSLEAGPPSENQ